MKRVTILSEVAICMLLAACAPNIESRSSPQEAIRPRFPTPEEYIMSCVRAVDEARNPVTGVLPLVTTCVDWPLKSVMPMPASVQSSTIIIDGSTNVYTVEVRASDGRILAWDGRALILIAR